MHLEGRAYQSVTQHVSKAVRTHQVQISLLDFVFVDVDLNGSFCSQRAGIRVHIEEPEESLGKRIRTAEKLKVPYMLVIGDKEVAAGNINARNYFSGEQREYSQAEFLDTLQNEIRAKKITEIVKSQETKPA